MNREQSNKRNMYSKLLVFFQDNGGTWSTFMELVNQIVAFVGLVGAIDAEVNKQAFDATGIAADKSEDFLDMVKKTVKYARKARVWAHNVGNSTLEHLFDVRKDDFTKMKQNVALARCKDIRQALFDNVGSLGGVNVTSGNVSAILTAITAFEASMGQPGAAQADQKSATDALPGLFELTDTRLDNIADLLINEYEETNADMVAAFINAHHIDNIGIHHTGISTVIEYSDGSGPAEGIQMKIVELNKTALSDIDGIDEIIRCKPGTYHIEFTGTGIVPKTIIKKITRGQILALHVEVAKA